MHKKMQTHCWCIWSRENVFDGCNCRSLLGKLTAFPKSLSWISGANLRREKEGRKRRELMKRIGRKVTGENIFEIHFWLRPCRERLVLRTKQVDILQQSVYWECSRRDQVKFVMWSNCCRINCDRPHSRASVADYVSVEALALICGMSHKGQ